MESLAKGMEPKGLALDLESERSLPEDVPRKTISQTETAACAKVRRLQTAAGDLKQTSQKEGT